MLLEKLREIFPGFRGQQEKKAKEKCLGKRSRFQSILSVLIFPTSLLISP